MKKRNRTLIIIAIAFVIAAIAFLIVGFAMAGNDILAWFGSKYAVLFYIVLGTYLLFIVFIFLGDMIKRL